MSHPSKREALVASLEDRKGRVVVAGALSALGVQCANSADDATFMMLLASLEGLPDKVTDQEPLLTYFPSTLVALKADDESGRTASFYVARSPQSTIQVQLAPWGAKAQGEPTGLFCDDFLAMAEHLLKERGLDALAADISKTRHRLAIQTMPEGTFLKVYREF